MEHEKISPLRISRVARGLSQPELAVAAEIGLTTLRRLEAGDPLTKEIAAKLARALGDVTPEERLAWMAHAVDRREERVAEKIAAEPGLADLIDAFNRARQAAEPQPREVTPTGAPAEPSRALATPEPPAPAPSPATGRSTP